MMKVTQVTFKFPVSVSSQNEWLSSEYLPLEGRAKYLAKAGRAAILKSEGEADTNLKYKKVSFFIFIK